MTGLQERIIRIPAGFIGGEGCVIRTRELDEEQDCPFVHKCLEGFEMRRDELDLYKILCCEQYDECLRFIEERAKIK